MVYILYGTKADTVDCKASGEHWAVYLSFFGASRLPGVSCGYLGWVSLRRAVSPLLHRDMGTRVTLGGVSFLLGASRLPGVSWGIWVSLRGAVSPLLHSGVGTHVLGFGGGMQCYTSSEELRKVAEHPVYCLSKLIQPLNCGGGGGGREKKRDSL